MKKNQNHALDNNNSKQVVLVGAMLSSQFKGNYLHCFPQTQGPSHPVNQENLMVKSITDVNNRVGTISTHEY